MDTTLFLKKLKNFFKKEKNEKLDPRKIALRKANDLEITLLSEILKEENSDKKYQIVMDFKELVSSKEYLITPNYYLLDDSTVTYKINRILDLYQKYKE